MKRLLLVLMLILGAVMITSRPVATYAYTDEEKQQAKSWLSSHGYPPTRAGAEQAYQDYMDGKIDVPEADAYMGKNQKNDIEEKKNSTVKTETKKDKQSENTNKNSTTKQENSSTEQTNNNTTSAKESTEQLTIRNKDQIETTTINLNAGKYLAKEKETDTDTIIYKASNISEQEFNKIYGKNGSIEVYIGETKYASVGYSQAEKEEDRKYETVYYVENAPENKQAGRIEYPEGTTNITIKTSNPQAEGKLKIEQEKAIKSTQDYGVKVENIEAIVESNKITSTKTYKTQEIKKDEKGEVVKDEAGNEVKEEKLETITATLTEAKGNIKLSEPTKQIKKY